MASGSTSEFEKRAYRAPEGAASGWSALARRLVFSRVGARAAYRVRALWGAFDRRRSVVGLRRESGPATSTGTVRLTARRSPVVPVVMCVWRRPHRLADTMSFLADQSYGAVKLYLWNNNPSLRPFVDDVIADTSALDVKVVHSPRNVGGFGRFYIARDLAFEHPFVVFLDDDQFGGPDFVESLVREFSPGTIHGHWAFRFAGREHYWDRAAAVPGERVKYCGAGGMLCDTRVFLDPGVFTCPKRFWFVEDLWLSYYVDQTARLPMYKSGGNLRMEPDAYDQFHLLYRTKDALFRHLVRSGWDPVL